jgi:AraC-like DNA-binding protein
VKVAWIPCQGQDKQLVTENPLAQEYGKLSCPQPTITMETVRVWKPSGFHDLELMYGTGITDASPQQATHTHEEYEFAIIEAGIAEGFHKGAYHREGKGTLILNQSGEAHTGRAIKDSQLTIRVLNIASSFLVDVASQITPRYFGFPIFPQFNVIDENLCNHFLTLHCQLERFERTATARLEIDALLTEFLAQLIIRYAEQRRALYAIGSENKAILQTREYLETHYAENVSLETLGHIASLSPFHLNRVFRRDMGVPPHVYLQQVRIRHAKYLLALEMPLAEIAVETGFFDQAHFQRQFKRFVGVTPGHYARASKSARSYNSQD